MLAASVEVHVFAGGPTWMTALEATVPRDLTPVQGIPLAAGSHAAIPQMVEDDAPAQRASGRWTSGYGRVPSWLLLVLLFGGGAGGGSLIAGFGAFANRDVERDVEAISEDVGKIEQAVEAHRTRLDGQDDDIETIRREQANHQRWVAGEIIKQSRALGKIGQKVGADIDVDVSQYQSEGL